jgi:hypothetical protein
MFQVERIRGDDNNHVKLFQQNNQLSSMPPREVEMMLACPGGPPLIAIPDVAEVTAHLSSYPGILRIRLKGIMHPISRDDLVPLVFTVVEIQQAELGRITCRLIRGQRCVFNRFEILSRRAASDRFNYE